MVVGASKSIPLCLLEEALAAVDSTAGVRQELSVALQRNNCVAVPNAVRAALLAKEE